MATRVGTDGTWRWSTGRNTQQFADLAIDSSAVNAKRLQQVARAGGIGDDA